MDPCNWKNAELTKLLQRYIGRVVLWEGNVKDEEGYKAVFTEQGTSAASKLFKIIWRLSQSLLRTAGEGSDAVSACSQVTMTEARRVLRLLDEGGPEIDLDLSMTKTNKLG